MFALCNYTILIYFALAYSCFGSLVRDGTSLVILLTGPECVKEKLCVWSICCFRVLHNIPLRKGLIDYPNRLIVLLFFWSESMPSHPRTPSPTEGIFPLHHVIYELAMEPQSVFLQKDTSNVVRFFLFFELST